jgi:hypothetical protein
MGVWGLARVDDFGLGLLLKSRQVRQRTRADPALGWVWGPPDGILGEWEAAAADQAYDFIICWRERRV